MVELLTTQTCKTRHGAPTRHSIFKTVRRDETSGKTSGSIVNSALLFVKLKYELLYTTASVESSCKSISKLKPDWFGLFTSPLLLSLNHVE